MVVLRMLKAKISPAKGISLMKSRCALILPGAVAKGAYEAGVIQVLVENDIAIDRIVATSSGALNGVAYAAGIRSGNERVMAAALVESWLGKGSWQSAFSPTPWNWLRGQGFSNADGLRRMLTELVRPCTASKKRNVELRIIVTPLKGVTSKIGNQPATTFEKVLHFADTDFDTVEGLSRIFDATTAACAFPGLFSPVDVEGLGPCIDGGTVNNVPLSYALDEGDVGKIIVPIPSPAMMPDTPVFTGLGLFNHMVEILINERFYRDLKNAHTVNDEIKSLHHLVSKKIINEKQYAAVLGILKTRHVDIVEVHPEKVVCRNPFAGFFSKDNRLRLVEEGREAARLSLKLKEKKKVKRQ